MSSCTRAAAVVKVTLWPLYGRSYTARDPEGHRWFFTTPPAER